jgi:hypothetical protein
MEDTMMACSLCDESFNSERELRNHQQFVHVAEVSNRRRSRDIEPEEIEPEEEDEQETAA